MHGPAKAEFLERIATSLEAIESHLRLTSLALNEMEARSNAWARLYEIGNAAEVWSESQLEE